MKIQSFIYDNLIKINMIILHAQISKPDKFLELVKLFILNEISLMDAEFYNNKSKKYMQIYQINNDKTKCFSFNSCSSTFKKYEFNFKHNLQISLNTCDLYCALKNSTSTDIVTLTLSNDFTSKLFVSINRKLYIIRLEDNSFAKVYIPPIQFDMLVTINSKYFFEFINQIKKEKHTINSQSMLSFIIDDDNMQLQYESGNCKTKSVICKNVQIDKLPNCTRLCLKILLESIELISKSFQFSNKIKLFFKNEYPVIIQYNSCSFGKVSVALPAVYDN